MSDQRVTADANFWGEADDAAALQGFRALVEATEDGIYQLDADGHFAAVNDAFADLTGYAREELLGEHVSVLLEDGTEALERSLINPTESDLLEFPVRTAEGAGVCCEFRVSPVDATDAIRGSVGIVRDITERREHERVLRETERRYRALTESFPNGIVMLFDHDLEYTLAAGQGFDRIPVGPTALEGRSVADSWGDTADAIEPAFEAALEGDERSVEVEYAGRDWLLHTVPITDERGDVFAGMAMAQDVTERTERERELAKYETIIETIDDGIYVKDEAGRFTMVNDAYTELTGYDREELVGEHASLVVDEATIESAKERLSATVDERSDNPAVEADILTADGDRVPTEGTFGTIRDGGDHEEVGVVRDITERKEYRQKLEESNERLEQFAYAASHDLQEPLRLVSSYLRLIERRYADELDDDGREFIDFAVDGADRMREMIEGLLEYSRIEAGGDPFESVDLETVLDDVLEDLRLQVEESDAEIRIESLPAVECDASQLRQVFQNLLDNAIEYSGEQPPRIHVEAERRDAEWVISVRDDGIGIDSNDVDRVFQVFQRLHSHEEHAGTGIGLALCRRIVERHGGEIWVDAEPGDGTTVSFTLPASTARDP